MKEPTSESRLMTDFCPKCLTGLNVAGPAKYPWQDCNYSANRSLYQTKSVANLLSEVSSFIFLEAFLHQKSYYVHMMWFLCLSPGISHCFQYSFKQSGTNWFGGVMTPLFLRFPGRCASNFHFMVELPAFRAVISECKTTRAGEKKQLLTV